MADRPVVIVVEPRAGVVPRRGRRAGGAARRRWARHRAWPRSPGNDATWIAAAISDADRAAAAQGAIETEGFRVRLLDIDPARVPPGLRRRQQRDALVRPPPPVRAGPAPAVRRQLHRGVGRLPRRQRSVRRRRRRGSARRCRRARAGLPPHPARATAARRATRPAAGALQPHAVRRARPVAGAAGRAPDRAARRHGRARRLRLPQRALGGVVHRRLPRDPRSRAEHVRRAARRPTPTTSTPVPPRPTCDSRARRARRHGRRSPAHRARRSHRAVEEPAARASTPSTTCSSATTSGAAG